MDAELEMRIRQRAHEMWEREGCPDGRAERHWLDVEHRVREEVENTAAERGRDEERTAGTKIAEAW